MDIQEKIQRGGSLRGEGLPELLDREKQMAEQRNAPLGSATSRKRGDEDRYGYRLPGGPAQLRRARVQLTKERETA